MRGERGKFPRYPIVKKMGSKKNAMLLDRWVPKNGLASCASCSFRSARMGAPAPLPHERHWGLVANSGCELLKHRRPLSACTVPDTYPIFFPSTEYCATFGVHAPLGVCLSPAAVVCCRALHLRRHWTFRATDLYHATVAQVTSEWSRCYDRQQK